MFPDKLYEETLEWVKRIIATAAKHCDRLKITQCESDELYASWQHGMELLAHVWGSEESPRVCMHFLKRKPDFKSLEIEMQK